MPPPRTVLVAGSVILLADRLFSAGTRPAELVSDAMLLLIAVLILLSISRFPECCGYSRRPAWHSGR
ncbi:MAG: hypothetical protein ABI806_00550 [Candidatus Solibacter sp.]